ncbi:elongation of very long chain fatty acids protein AAEL008004-like [Coccinella septempunctata]|uniref:elongation of very long chain fatty acids protein AAEL008004-like n=1 Tax=Coccinella septempunctata TaxID=41139 RepID=UPI001D0903F9|nr:elongation of very long chain fatty acids protein AAEL008004-like [Coccinella septempunctata]
MFPNYIDDFIDKYSDPRIKGSHSIWEPAILITLYILLVRKIGPWYMKNKQPYNVRTFIMIFDAIQVITNLYFVIEVAKLTVAMTGSFFCLEKDETDSDFGKRCIYFTKLYYWLKVSDLLDTVFFILRKSWRQVSYLHVYHHTIMVFFSWLMLKLSPGGHLAYFGLANSFVHTFMYTYYLLSAYDSSYKKNLTLKKMVTQVQLIQFCFIAVVFAPTMSSSCSFPSSLGFIAVTQSIYFIYLFGNFYYNSYIKTDSGNHRGSKSK